MEIVAATIIGVAVGGIATAYLMRRSVVPVASPTITSAVVVRREIERARRYERQFALIRVESGTPDRADDFATDSTLEQIKPVLRALDYVWIERSGMHILLPEIGRAEAERCVSRLRDAVDGPVVCRVAVFPDDAVTDGALALRLDGSDESLPASHDLPIGSATIVRPPTSDTKQAS